MEIIAGVMIGACVGIAGRFAYELAKARRANPEKREHVYLVRFSQNGKVEIKPAPAALWTWRY